MAITADQAREMVRVAVRRLVPGADLDGLQPDADLRHAFEFDPLDFVGFVELLSEQSGLRIDERDYPELTSLAACVEYLESRSP